MEKQEQSPALAAVFSLIVAGSGQIYNGQIGKGLLIFFTSGFVLPWVYGIIDAYITAQKIKEGKIAAKPRMGCAIAMLAVMGLMFVFVAIMGLLAAIAIPNFVMARERAMTSACIMNLKQIQYAKEAWVAETGAPGGSAPGWRDLIPAYLNERPACPAEGSYTIGNIYSPAICSIGDNGTPEPEDDHSL